MIVFVTAPKDGTGRSVTAANVAYRYALHGSGVSYVDFDFGYPHAGALFGVEPTPGGYTVNGVHSFLLSDTAQPHTIDLWRESERVSLRERPSGAGRLVLYPGDTRGTEFPATQGTVDRCTRLLQRLDEEFEVILVDLSAGRSHAADMVLAATAAPELRRVLTRWLVCHRWTHQQVIAAHDLAFGPDGILDFATNRGHDRSRFERSLKTVRIAVVDPDSPSLAGLHATQVAWLKEYQFELSRLASQLGVGHGRVLAEVPLEPVLQWREQLITDLDVVSRRIANTETVDAFERIARLLGDPTFWPAS